MDRVAVLIDQILNKDHTEAEWFNLRKQFDDAVSTLPEAEYERLVESGAGEMLDMVCSGFEFNKANGK